MARDTVSIVPLPGQPLLGVRVADCDRRSVLRYMDDLSRGPGPHAVFFANAYVLTLARTDSVYRAVLNDATAVLNDGIGISLAAWLHRGRLFRDNLNGTDLIPEFCRFVQDRHAGFFLLGGGEGVADLAARRLAKEAPGIRIVGTHSGYFSQTEPLIEKIRAASPDVLLVGFGNPLQEFWIHRNVRQLGVPLCLGVGGLFDFLSGRVRRAPRWMSASGLEWLFRLSHEPRRLWRRYLLGGPRFAGYVLWSWCREKLRADRS